MRLEIPLSELKDGERGTITSIRISQGSRRECERTSRVWGMARRVMDMGLTPGTEVTIVKSALFRGPLEVLVRGSTLILGRGMAEKIFVEVKR